MTTYTTAEQPAATAPQAVEDQQAADGSPETATATTTRAVADRQSTGVQSVERVFDVLETMAEAGGEMSLSDIAAASTLPLPTIHRLIRTLVNRGYVRQQPSRRYALGPRLINLGEAAGGVVASTALPYLNRLVDAFGETANVAMLDGDRATYVAQVPSRHAMRMFTEVGRRVHLHCTGVGKALLAALPEDDARAVVLRGGLPAQTSHTMTDVDVLMGQIAQVRARGYALDEGEQEIGVNCLAVPVPGGPTRTAISISGPAARVTPELVARAVPVLLAVADEFAAELSD